VESGVTEEIRRRRGGKGFKTGRKDMLHVRMSADLKQEIYRYAAQNDLMIAEVIELAFDKLVKKVET
jgi:hypothetical protein